METPRSLTLPGHLQLEIRISWKDGSVTAIVRHEIERLRLATNVVPKCPSFRTVHNGSIAAHLFIAVEWNIAATLVG